MAANSNLALILGHFLYRIFMNLSIIITEIYIYIKIRKIFEKIRRIEKILVKMIRNRYTTD